jgi:hypothetical protein
METMTETSKVPEVTFGFWIIKIFATTLGEVGGNAVTMQMGFGYLIGSAIFAALLIVVVGAQIMAKRFQPFLYWAMIGHLSAKRIGRFECPECGLRCRHVYLRDVFACRRCHRLDNASRHLRRQTPGVGRVERLRRKLGNCDIRPFGPLSPRRRGRSRAYHEKLVAMIHAEEARLIGHLGGVVHDLKRRIRIRVRKARGEW